MSRHLLISARDPGAAAHLGQVARTALADPGWQVTVLVAPPADAVMRRLHVSHQVIRDRGDKLTETATRLLAEIKPDVLLAGLSGPDSGLDEALLQAAGTLPCYLFQDYWGDLNPATPTDVSILCLDAEGVRQTEQRFGRKASAVGSPAHDTWPNPRLARARLRRHHRLGKRTTVTGLCEQPLWQVPGYGLALRQALRCLHKGKLLLRPHPRDDWKDRLRLRRLARGNRVPATWSAKTALPDFIAGCDLILSAYSSCAMDATHCNRLPGHTGTIAVNLLCTPPLYRHYRQTTGFERTPLAAQGLAVDITQASRLCLLLARALQPVARHLAHTRTRAALPPGNAAGRLLRTLRDALS